MGRQRLEGGAVMAQQMPYLSTDPAAGEYLSLDPNAGEPIAPSPVPSPPPSGVAGFFGEATAGLNPRNINAAIQSAFWHPVATAKGMLAAQDVPRQKGLEAFQRGDYVTGTRHFIDWLIPVLGPRLDEAADWMQQGEYARGLGATTDAGLQIAAPKMISKLPSVGPAIVERLPAGMRAGAAQTAERAAQGQMIGVMAPKTGPQKIRFGNLASDVATDVARRTSAITRSGLADEVAANLERATTALDEVYRAVPAGQRYPTAPILAGLQAELKKLGVQGSRGAVEPATRAAQIASLKQAIAEVRALGSSVDLPNLRTLRIAFDEGAQGVFAPATAADYLATRGAGEGWATARTVLNDFMTTRHPELKAKNADVSLWLKTRDVLNAAEEAERVRPRVGRTIAAHTMGAIVGGGIQGGGAGAAIGAALGPVIERVLANASPALKLATARRLTRLSDALRRNDLAGAGAALNTVSSVLPAAERVATVTQALRILRGLEPEAIRPGLASEDADLWPAGVAR
jgi:hypothetical protein